MSSNAAASSGKFGLSQLAQIAVNVRDISRATKFYRDTLGMQHLFSAGTLSFFNAGGIRLMLTHPEQKELDHPSSLLYFRVDDIKKSYAELKSRGVKFEEEPHVVARIPHEVWLAAFRDSENNLMALMSEVSV